MIQDLFLITLPNVSLFKGIFDANDMHFFFYIDGKTYCTSIEIYLIRIIGYNMTF